MKSKWQKAAKSGDVEALGRLLQDSIPSEISPGASAKSLLDSLDKHGQTALMIAAMHGRAAAAHLLIEQRAELNHTAKFGLSALMLAVINNHAEIVRMLVEAGADLQIRGSGAPGFFQKTALDLAEGAGREELCTILRQGIT